MEKEKLIKVLDFLGDLLDSEIVTKPVDKQKLSDVGIDLSKEKSPQLLKRLDLMDSAKENFSRVLNTITESDKPSSLDYEAKEEGLKQFNEHEAIKMVIEQYITDSHDTTTIVHKVLGSLPSIEASRSLRLFIKNTWDTISKLENSKLIDKTKLSELKEQHNEAFMIESKLNYLNYQDKSETSDDIPNKEVDKE